MNYGLIIDLYNITIEDCIELYKKGMVIIINDGEIINFEKEENDGKICRIVKRHL